MWLSFDNSVEFILCSAMVMEQCDKLFDMGISDFDFVLIDAAKSHYRRFFVQQLESVQIMQS